METLYEGVLLMIYKTSFNGLELSVHGVYSAYNLTPDELKSLKNRFPDKINGSGSNYTVYCNAERHLWLKLFVHEVWIPIRFDLRRDFLELTNSKKIFTKDIEKISKELKNRRIEIQVDYNIGNNTWSIVNYERLLNLIKELV